MTPTLFHELILAPAAAAMIRAGAPMTLDTAPARLLLLAIAGQESAWSQRRQVPHGQARSFWQIQKEGALRGVMAGRFAGTLDKVLLLYSIPTFDEDAIFEALAWNDTVAYTVARLALWMDPHPLPALGDIDAAWACYLRVWRPGKPSWQRWNDIYPEALGC